MGLTLGQALRLVPPTVAPGENSSFQSIAFVGAGGKTAAIFALARELEAPVVVTSTTHFGAWQIRLADQHIVAKSEADLQALGDAKVTLVTGEIQGDQRTAPTAPTMLRRLREVATSRGLRLLVEADGARQRALKAPTAHEPAIPDFVSEVVVVAGLGGLGRPLTEAVVHRPEVFSHLAGISMGTAITGDALAKVLTHDQGGLKDVPPGAKLTALLNQADTLELQAEANGLAPSLLARFDSVVIATLRDRAIHAVQEPCAGVILAAGDAKRFGSLKQLLTWNGEPFVRSVAAAALAAGLSPVVLVTGAGADEVESAVRDMPVIIARNGQWRDGQSSSIRAGLAALPRRVSSAVFLLADQPQVTAEVIRALVELHSAGLHPIVAPLIRDERRGNPVLFDRVTFPDLEGLRGDVGGRSLFSKHCVQYLPWHDDRLLLDVDTQEDYDRLVGETRQ